MTNSVTLSSGLKLTIPKYTCLQWLSVGPPFSVSTHDTLVRHCSSNVSSAPSPSFHTQRRGVSYFIIHAGLGHAILYPSLPSTGITGLHHHNWLIFRDLQLMCVCAIKNICFLEETNRIQEMILKQRMGDPIIKENMLAMNNIWQGLKNYTGMSTICFTASIRKSQPTSLTSTLKGV